MKSPLSSRAATLCVLGALAMGGVAERTVAQEGTMLLRAGEVLTVFTSAPVDGANEARTEYFEAVLPMAAEFGFRSMASLRIEGSRYLGSDEVQVSPALSLYSWPSEAERESFERHAPFFEWRDRRPQLWTELREASVVVDEDVHLRFDEAQLYRVVLLWENPERPDDFGRYQEALSETVAGLGGRYVVRGRGTSFASLRETVRPPEHIWIIEWPSREAHRAYQASEAFQAHHHLFMSGVQRFEVHETRFAGPAG